MKKSILNLGKTLSRAEQKNVFGGGALISWDNGPDECSGPDGDFPCLVPNPEYDPNSEHLVYNPGFIPGVCRDGFCYVD